MNNTTYTFLIKSILIFVFFAFQLQAFSITYYSRIAGNSSKNFEDVNSWSSAPDGSGQLPKTEELKGSIPTRFVVQTGIIITLSNPTKIQSLMIEPNSTFIMHSSLEILENLTMDYFTVFDFENDGSTLIVGGDLLANNGARIKQIGNAGVIQTLILKGENNALAKLETNGSSSSIVRYAGGDQFIFDSDSYQNLVLEGSGTKTLTSPNGTETIIHAGLSIKNCTLKLNDFNLIYNGSNTKLTYSNGWINTNGLGMLKNKSAETVQTFPVGDDSRMQAVQINHQLLIPNLEYGVRYSSANTNVPNKGMGVWNIDASNGLPADIILLNPASATATISPASQIAAFTNNSWQTKATDYNSGKYTLKQYALTSTNTLSLYDCISPIKISPPTISGFAFKDVPYSTYPFLQLSNGIAPYTLVNSTSTPSGLTAGFVDQSNGILNISGTPNTAATYQVKFKISDASNCAIAFMYNIEVREPVTVWDGNQWSNGEPFSYIDAVFTGNYTTPSGTQTIAKNITVQSGVTVTLGSNSELKAEKNIANNGTIINNCTSRVSFNVDGSNGTYVGKSPVEPIVKLSPLTYGVVNQEFTQTVTSNIVPTSSFPSPTYTLSDAIPGLTLDPAMGIFSGKPSSANTYTFTLDYKYGNCALSKKYTLAIIEPASPNLYIEPIDSKTYDDADFKLTAYSKNTATPIVYSINPATACVTLLPDNILHITCAGPVPNNSITITATQAAATIYKEESVTTSFFISKAEGKLQIKNTGFLPNTTNALAYKKNSDGAITFTQLTGRDLATVTSDGQVTTFENTGTFSVLVHLDGTDNFTNFDSVYVLTEYSKKQAPVAVNDTILIHMGEDTTFNINTNDFGITDPINPTLTDIDIENSGIQKKYYVTSLGTFTIDPSGILTITPFEGFIGNDRIGYTVSDEGGLTSNIAYLQITVDAPFKLPELKGSEIMTPNNDGLNDALVIANTNTESENTLVVSDEIGNVVFEQPNYHNDWKGTNKKGTKLGAGVYFYVFTEKNTGRMLQNYIQIAGY